MEKASEKKTEDELVCKMPRTYTYFYIVLPKRAMHMVTAFRSDQWLSNLSARTAP